MVRSPGRVNLIGEHTDYNEGFVLPAAIDRAITVALGARNDARMTFFAADVGQHHECSLEKFSRSEKGWPNYLLGVVDQLRKAGYPLGGFNCVFGGDVPIGAGISSSAAIEGGLAYGLNELFGFGITPLQLVKFAQRAENDYVGVRCGIMDQFINIFGREGHVLRIDCRSLEYHHVPLRDDGVRIVLCDSGVRRGLAGSEYNARRQQCEAGVRVLKQFEPGVHSLRDATPGMLEGHRGALDPVVYRRCRYVVAENLRVLGGCDDLERGNVRGFGAKMLESHNGLRDDYEVSCPELDLLVELASDVDGFLGGRMMGAGFGGCTVNLVEETRVPALKEVIEREYLKRIGMPVKIHVCSITGGTSRILREPQVAEEESVKSGL
jgi:galactokinase